MRSFRAHFYKRAQQSGPGAVPHLTPCVGRLSLSSGWYTAIQHRWRSWTGPSPLPILQQVLFSWWRPNNTVPQAFTLFQSAILTVHLHLKVPIRHHMKTLEWIKSCHQEGKCRRILQPIRSRDHFLSLRLYLCQKGETVEMFWKLMRWFFPWHSVQAKGKSNCFSWSCGPSWKDYDWLRRPPCPP